jgi:hypothetical protein
LHTLENLQKATEAKNMLQLFGFSYANLYGLDTQTYTLHAITHHLADDASLYGSLSEHSMFSLESEFGLSVRALKGNRGFINQIIRSHYY